jgi:hypothetical protein
LQYQSQQSPRPWNEGAGYFISIDGRDPDAAFLKQIAGHRPSVRPGSQYRKGKNDVLFQITACEPGKAKVSCRGAEEDLSRVYDVERNNGVWTVTSAICFILCG